ncbi:MAG: cytochrome c [Ignavibacteria bacterium]|nr:cytochrome c [Ignavibacteria bacterium]
MSDLKNLFNKTKLSLTLFAFAAICLSDYSYPQYQGETIFKKTCIACHTIGSGRLVGPDLKNVFDRRSEEWIISFVKSSQSMIKSGDPDAVAIFNEYNKLVMLDQNLTDDQIKDVMRYIKKQSSGSGQTTALTEDIKSSTGMTIDEARENEVSAGRNLFLGKIRLTNGGPACMSCHNVTGENLVAGGLLAMDLTNTYSKLNAPGIYSIMFSSPFPIMSAAYNNNNITKDEAFYLIAFLKQSDTDSANQQPVNYQSNFLWMGLLGTVILFGLYGGMWWNRKRKPVNDKIFKRQLKTY